MSKNPGRELRKLLRKKFSCFHQNDIRVGKYGSKRQCIRICLEYGFDNKKETASKNLEKLFDTYSGSFVQMHRYSTCQFLEIILKIDSIDSIMGLISLSL